MLEKVKEKVTNAKDFASTQLEQIKQTTQLMAKLPRILKSAPKEIKFDSLEIETDDEIMSLYLTINCEDEPTYSFLKQFADFDVVLPRILETVYAKYKSGELDEAIRGAQQAAAASSAAGSSDDED